MKQKLSPPMSLTHDERIMLRRKDGSTSCRMRVWQARGRAAVVLVTPIRGSKGRPSVGTTKFADYAYRHCIGLAEWGMFYFDVENGSLFTVNFDLIESDRMLRFASPKRAFAHESDLEELVGQHVDL